MDEVSFFKTNKSEIERLKLEIVKAFSNAKQPEKDNIALHECEECIGVRKDFAGIKWQEANDKLLERNFDKLPLFSPQAFNYYLPTYLIYTLNNFDDEYSEVCEFTLYALTPGKDWKNKEGKISTYWIEKLSFFTLQQMKIIFDFLELAKQNPIYNNDATSIERAFDRLKAIKSVAKS